MSNDFCQECGLFTPCKTCGKGGGALTTNEDPTNPSHYTAGGVECIDAIDAATIGLVGIEAFCTGNAIKYLWRWRKKNKAEDLRKAKWYIDRLLAGMGEK